MPHKCFLCSSPEHEAQFCPRLNAHNQTMQQNHSLAVQKHQQQQQQQNSQLLFSDITDKTPRFLVARGLQFVLPYYYTFAVHVKGRWTGKRLFEAFAEEFPHYPLEYFDAACRAGRLHVVWDKCHQRAIEKQDASRGKNTGGAQRRGRQDDNEDEQGSENDDEAAEQPPQALSVENCSPQLELKLGMIVLHTLHRHELPVLASSVPIQIVDFVHVPSASTVSTAASQPLRGVIVVNKPASVPVHSCGRYFANTVQYLLRCGNFVVSETAAKKLTGSLRDEARTSDVCGRAAELLRTSVFGREGDSGGLHSVHRLDKNTSGVLLFATCPEVSVLVFNALSDKSTETAAAAGGGGADDEDGGGALVPPPWEQPATAMCKVYLARVAGHLDVAALAPSLALEAVRAHPATGDVHFLVQRSIFCASPKDGVVACLTPEQEAQAAALRKEKRRRREEEEAAAKAAAIDAAASTTAPSAAGANNTTQKQKEEKRLRQAQISKGNNARAAVAQAGNDDGARAAAAVEVAKWAATWFRVVRYDAASNETVVECFPVTGRTHQLRVHLAALGHPILGDDIYGYKTPQVNSAAAAAASCSSSSINARTATNDESLAWRAEAWTRDFARLAGGGGATSVDTSPMQPGVDHGADPFCVECGQQPQRRHFLDGSPFLALHAHRYRVSLPSCGVSADVVAPAPAWAQ